MPARSPPPSPAAPPAKRARVASASSASRDDSDGPPGEAASSPTPSTSTSPPPPPSPTFAQTIAAWKWKREHLSDKARFHAPYVHTLDGGGEGGGVTLTLAQTPYGPEGFASTVWDSSIVLARYIERHAATFAGKSCLDLSAGVGLVAAVAAAVVPTPARVVATDLPPNLPLLQANLTAAAAAAGQPAATVAALTWGDAPAASSLGLFDAVFAADVAYIPDAVPALAATLAAVTARSGTAYIAHGRNRGAWRALRRALREKGLTARLVEQEELHPGYRTVDVDVWRVAWRRRREE